MHDVLGQDNKHAFLFGVGAYQASAHLTNLQSVSSDLIYTKAVLESHGFQCTEFLANHKDKASIISAFKHNFSSQLKRGDIALIYYSGHGTQVEDMDGDECDQDGKDEALVLSHFEQEEPRPDQYILDDEIHELLLPIREKVGPEGQVILIVDACHSGSISRGRTAANSIKKQANLSFSNCSTIADSDLAPLIGLYSSFDDAKSFEFGSAQQKYGIFTYSLMQRLSLCDFDYSYADWFAQTELFMMDRFSIVQQPTLEGASSQLIWRNGVKPTPLPQAIVSSQKSAHWIDPASLQSRGSRLIAYPKGHHSAATPIYFKDSDYTIRADGTIEFHSEAGQELAVGDLIYVENGQTIEAPLNIYFPNVDHPLAQSVLEQISISPYIEATPDKTNRTLYFDIQKKKGVQVLQLKADTKRIVWQYVLESDSTNLDVLKSLQAFLTSFWNGQILEHLETTHMSQISWVIQRLDENGLVKASDITTIESGDIIEVKLTNDSDQTIWPYLFYVDSNGSIQRLDFSLTSVGPKSSTGLQDLVTAYTSEGVDQLYLFISYRKLQTNYFLNPSTVASTSIDFFISCLDAGIPIPFSLSELDQSGILHVDKQFLVNKR